ncbi:hypothetical protein CV102_22170 [Natronococcus pandeyae]|uniref:Pyridoxamine 5'-phosphate oxidase family protein n=1 Tax=Natronococcus pandeyae TaxID=2055836 RepID=A0A8J8PXZ7_9EURY|nr:pyridoxamine 5'-phosphate oxidase family protein [Natronococcus pandeyae]TYL36530.1 hypothetical protein CV102_22170 [Natronococcus pandeyae]
MTDDELEAFLYGRGTGVLSLSQGGHSYGIPVSYGYDSDHGRFVLDLGFGPESKKRSFLETTERSCLTVYEWTAPTDWRSVVATGELDELSDGIDHDLEELYYEYAKDVEISVFDHPPEEVELQWYTLEIDELTGRSSR